MRALTTALVLGCALVHEVSAVAEEKIVLGRLWPADQRRALDGVDHQDWTKLLGQYVDPQGQVDYAAWKASADATARLDTYLDELSRGEPSRPAQRPGVLAFWINAYNALTVRGILREYPTTSIRHHTAGQGGYRFWDDLLLRVGDGQYSLTQIEHQQLRPLGDPRIHFAIVCASRGCPRLAQNAYTPEDLEAQLVDNARAFFAEPSKFGYDTATGELDLSWIFSYYAGDFGADQAARLRTIAPYLPDEAARRLATDPEVRIKVLPYDWSLNGR